MGAGTIFEEGGQETVAPIFFHFAHPTFKFAHPGNGALGGQKRIVAHP